MSPCPVCGRLHSTDTRITGDIILCACNIRLHVRHIPARTVLTPLLPIAGGAGPLDELTARENALADRCSCFRGALLNGDDEHPDCVAAGACLDEHPELRPVATREQESEVQ